MTETSTVLPQWYTIQYSSYSLTHAQQSSLLLHLRHQFTTTATYPKLMSTPRHASSMNTFIHYVHACLFMGTDYFLKHSQNTQILCYAKQCCFPNKLYFMTEPAEQGLDRVSLSESNEPRSLFLSPVNSISSTGPLKTHLVPFNTTNTTNTAYPKPQPKAHPAWRQVLELVLRKARRHAAYYSCLESTFCATFSLRCSYVGLSAAWTILVATVIF